MLMAAAEAYLKQLDLRRRQVAVKVQILNVRLENDRFGCQFLCPYGGHVHRE